MNIAFIGLFFFMSTFLVIVLWSFFALYSEPTVGSLDWAIENTYPSTTNELLCGWVSSHVFSAVLSQHFKQPPRDAAASIGLRSSVRSPPGCRQTRVGDEVDTRSRRYLRVKALKAHKARRAAVCLYKWLSGCLMETLLHLLPFFWRLLEMSVLGAPPSF